MVLQTVELPNFEVFVNDAWKKLTAPENRLTIKSEIIGNRDATLPQEIPGEGGIYAIWVNDELKYIGTVRNEQGLKRRLTQHLIKCPKRTQSKLKKVKKSAKKHMISVSFIHVEPEPFRLALEDELIRSAKKAGLVAWNQKSIK